MRPFLDLPGETSDPAISPDGKTLAFAWWTPDINSWGLYTQTISGGQPRLFDKAEDGISYSPKWSPDGKWIAFLRSGSPRTSGLVVKTVSGAEERWLGPVCSDGVAWTADSRSIIAPNNDNTDMLEACRLAVVPIEPGEPSWQLANRGNEPAMSSDGKTLAFTKDGELHLLSVTPEGRAAGIERTLVRENLAIWHPVWVPGDREIVYQLDRDRSVIRRVEAREGAKPRDNGSIDGEFNILSFVPKGGPVLAEVQFHDDSYWRIDLQALEPHFEKLRRLPWNVGNLTLSPDGRRLLYTVARRGGSEFFTSKIDGTAPRLLFSLPYERVDRVAWSPDGRKIAFAAEQVVRQLSPSQLFVCSAVNWAPRRLMKQFEDTNLIGWSQDGSALFLVAGSVQDSGIWQLRLADNQLTRISSASGRFNEQTDGKFIYSERLGRPFPLVRIPVAGGPDELLVNGALQQFIVTDRDLYYVRQDASPPTTEGLNLYRFNLATRSSRLVGNSLGFWRGQLQLSPGQRFIYGEKHDQPHRGIVTVQNWN